MAAADHIALQRAVYTALCAHAPLLAVLPDGPYGIGVLLRAGTGLPYVVIEGLSSQPMRTQTDTLDECAVTCAVYGEHPELTQVRSVLQEVATALAAPLAVDDHHVVLQQVGAMQAPVAGDGRIYRGACTVRVILERLEV